MTYTVYCRKVYEYNSIITMHFYKIKSVSPTLGLAAQSCEKYLPISVCMLQKKLFWKFALFVRKGGGGCWNGLYFFSHLKSFFFFFSISAAAAKATQLSFFLFFSFLADFFLDHFSSLFFFLHLKLKPVEAKQSYKSLKFIHKICTQKQLPYVSLPF